MIVHGVVFPSPPLRKPTKPLEALAFVSTKVFEQKAPQPTLSNFRLRSPTMPEPSAAEYHRGKTGD